MKDRDIIKYLIIAEYYPNSGVGTYLNNLTNYLSKKSKVITIVNIQSKMTSGIFFDGFYLNRPSIFRRVFYKFPISLIYDLYVLLPLIFKHRPTHVIVSVASNVNFLGVFFFSRNITFVNHSVIKNENKGFFKVRHFINLFLSSKKKIIAVSEFQKSNILQYWVETRNKNYITVIHNACIEKISNASKTNSTIRIITCANLVSYKNPMIWIKVAANVISKSKINIVFEWYGDGPLFSICEELVDDHLKSRIIFKRAISDLSDKYSSSHIYLHTSEQETHGLSIIEAMSFSLPCVAFDVGGIKESIINNNYGFLVKYGDVDEMVKILLMLINDENLRNEIGKNAYSYFKSKFSIPVWEKNMDKFFEK